MSTAVDDDTLAAVRLLWAATAALPALTDRAIVAGAVRSPREQPLPLPYAHAACENLPGKGMHYVKAIRKDVRKVTLTVWGTYAQCRLALPLMLGTFNLRMGGPEGLPGLAYPSGARFIKWWPVDDGSLAQEQGEGAQKAGEDVWLARVTAEVYSVRQEA